MNSIFSKDSLTILLDESSNLSINQIKRLLNKMNSAELAHCLESSPPKQRKLLWSLIDNEDEGDVLADLGDEIQQELLLEISNEELSEVVRDLQLDEIVDILQHLPKKRMNMILGKMSSRDRQRIQEALVYPEDSAGGLLNTDVISVRPGHTVEVVMNYLRSQSELPENTDKIFVVSSDDLYLGEILITSIITSDPSLTVREIMETDVNPILASIEDKEVATLFERNDLISSAVVDTDNKLIGRITIDDVVDVIKEDADQNFLGMAGIAEDTFQPPGRAARSRVIWLSMNLLTAFVAAMTINIFQNVIDQIVFVAVLMPIVASMGGVAATQTLTIVLRGLTLEQINSSNLRWLFKRELAVAILNGFVLAILIGASTMIWFGDITLAILIAAALIINLISSVVAGILVPIALRRFNQDLLCYL